MLRKIEQIKKAFGVNQKLYETNLDYMIAGYADKVKFFMQKNKESRKWNKSAHY